MSALTDPRPALPTAPVEGSDAPARTATPVRARWEHLALGVLLAGTGVLYLAGLGASGWANAYYSAAAQAASRSWSALFYGALDAAGSITVDKTPASLWVMGLSVRVFGLSSWSILVPEALMGVAAVGLLYATVRRGFPAGAALLAGATLAVTPAAALMFRFNNPDALLVLLLVAAAYATVRAAERGSARWMVLVGVLVGFGFLTKMLQGLLVVPGFALAYLSTAPIPLRRRFGHLLLAGLALVVSAGWWVAVVELTPAAARPYIGGSQTNSVLDLTLGYNGLGRLSGSEAGSVGGPMGWGQSGWARLLDAENASFIAWLLPAAAILLVAGLWATRRAGRARQRSAFLVWGSWLVVTALVFSFMQGIYHSYYTVALAPAVAAVVGMGAAVLWERRQAWQARAVLALAVAMTAAWSGALLVSGGESYAWIGYPVLVVGAGAALALLAVGRVGRRIAAGLAVLTVVAVLTGPAAYAVTTAATPHTGAIPTVGSTVPGGGPGGGPFGRSVRGGAPGLPSGGFGPPGAVGSPGAVGPLGGFGPPGAPTPSTGGGLLANPFAAQWRTSGRHDGSPHRGRLSAAGEFGAGPRGTPGPMGGLLGASEPSAELVALLQRNSSAFTWVAATVGANNAAGYQLATDSPVMAIGGFNGTDPSPTLARFQQWVAQGRIHFYLAADAGPSNARSGTAGAIAEWVATRFSQVTVDGVTVYDLSQPR